MATNLLREKTLMQKKTECFFASALNEGTDNGDIGTASADYLLANLPPESIVTNAYIQVGVAADAATSSTGTLGTTEGGSEILSAADLKAVGQEGTFTGATMTDTGVPLYLGITVSGAATAVGEYVVVVEYLEYTKKSGEYTRV